MPAGADFGREAGIDFLGKGNAVTSEENRLITSKLGSPGGINSEILSKRLARLAGGETLVFSIDWEPAEVVGAVPQKRADEPCR